MDKQEIPGKATPQLRDLAAGDTVSIIGRGGSVVRVLQGRTWITQEGDARDYVVPAGMRFCAAHDGHIVVSAVADDTRIAIYHISPASAADWTRNQVRLDPGFTLTARREAQREMARYVADLVSRLWRHIRMAWSRRTLPRRSGAALPMRSFHG
jgi:Protein of unknown function (DUF2917)